MAMATSKKSVGRSTAREAINSGSVDAGTPFDPTVGLPGLPEGVRLQGFRVATKDEWAFDRGDLMRGPTGYKVMVASPAQGYDFLYDIATNTYKSIRVFGKAKRMVIIFEAKNESERAAIAELHKHPQFIGFERE